MKHLYTSMTDNVSELDGESPLSMKWDFRKRADRDTPTEGLLTIQFKSRKYEVHFTKVEAVLGGWSLVDEDGS